MEFLKLDPDIDSDPAIMRAGWAGARFYELLLKVSAKKDLKGRITHEYQDLEWLARLWNLGPTDMGEAIQVAAFMARAKDAAQRGGLVTVDGDGAWIIRGWEKYYRPAKSGKQRQAEYEARQLTNLTGLTKPDEAPSASVSPDEEDSASVSPDAPDETDATSRHVTPRTPPTPPTYVERAPAGKGFVPLVPEKPTKPDEAWDGLDFWAWAQAKRAEAGFPSERRPNERTVSTWWAARCMEGITAKQLRLAFVAFGNEPFWVAKERKPPIPFGGFLSQWDRFISPEVNRVAG